MISGNSDEPDDREESNERTGSNLGLRSGLSGLFALLRTLEETGEHRRIGHLSSGSASVDYGVTIGTGLGNRRARPNSRSGQSRQGDLARQSARERPVSEDYLVTSRRDGERMVVFADLPGVEADELTIGLDGDGGVLVIAVEGATVKRLSLPWAAEAERNSFNNGVLEVHLREKP